MARKLVANVFADGKWFGPSYPDAGLPPEGSVGDHVFEADEEKDAAPARRSTKK